MQLQVFNHKDLGQVRVMGDNENPLFCLSDVCKSLNIQDTFKVKESILREFELYSDIAHIINGHTPVKTVEGESPIRANGKLIVIDGGFCNHYHKTTGIAGYTLIFNSHGLRIKSHHPFESIFKAVIENKDIDSDSNLVETERKRVRVKNTDIGRGIEKKIEELMELLEIYRREKY